MSDTLAQSFGRGNGRKATWQGATVYSYATFSVRDGDVIHLTRLSASPTRAQALKIAIEKAELRANGVLASTLALWSHTAPVSAKLEVVGRRARSIDIWNAWSFGGVDSAWLGNAGMLVEGEGPQYTLRCSDGVGPASFTDLVVRVEINSRG